MTDVSSTPDPSQSLKRLLEDEQPEKIQLPRPIHSNGLSALPVEDRNAAENGSNTTSSSHQHAASNSEPAAKRLRIEDGASGTPLPNVDTRDKIKGVALVKEE
jgi:hypothetical protein